MPERSSALDKALSLADFEPMARRRLPRPLYGYIAGAAEDGTSRDRNATSFADWQLVPRTLVDVSGRSQKVKLFGTEYASPFGIAPMGIVALSTYRGDVAMATAAHRCGVPAVLSGTSLIPMEEVGRAAPGTWFQAYLPGDECRIGALIDRVAHARYETLVVTVDIPVAGNRESHQRVGFSTPLRPSLRLAWDGLVRPRWLAGTLLRTVVKHGIPRFENSFAVRGAPIISATAERDFSGRDHLCWTNLAAIRRQWKGALVVKGVLDPADVRSAFRLGADGIILSNHGGRQLDGAVSPMHMLQEAVDVAGNLPVMIDGGFTRGTHVLKALALGARMVFIGRPFNYAASVGGEKGVTRAIHLLQAEIDRDLAMLGVNGCGELCASHVRPRQQQYSRASSASDFRARAGMNSELCEGGARTT
ncbi:MAG: alpha-hydroxy acid oxidase [Pseudomonadota bacterium]